MKRIKKISALILSLVLVFSMLAGSKISVDAATGSNTVTVYYSNSWSNAYIHYQVGNGSWTTVPGVRMETSGIEGYTWKYVINLGSADSATVCFNNGNGIWDSRNGDNYTVWSGSYGIKNGQVQKLLSVTISADKPIGGTNNRVLFTAQASGGTAPYKYQYTFIGKTEGTNTYSSLESDSNTYYWNMYTAGTYNIAVDVKDANGLTARAVLSDYVVEGPKFEYFTASKASPQKTGTEIILKAKFINMIQDRYNFYSYSVSDGTQTTWLDTNVDDTATWIPTKEGHYTLTAKFRWYSGREDEISMDYIISNEESVTIYYNNDSWQQAYIHYKVGNGNWTSVPGVRMETSDVSGYRWKYKINLGNADNVTVCFNNGSGSWDSQNGLNYTYGKGTYYLNH